MTLTIERAAECDAPKLVEVQNRSFHDDYVRYGECPSYGEPEEAVRSYIRELIVYKIVLDGEIVGDMIIRRRAENRYYLRVIAVVPEHWNEGIGALAMRFIERDNPAALVWELNTPHDSLRNHHFYEKLGYRKVGEIPCSDRLTLWKYRRERAETA